MSRAPEAVIDTGRTVPGWSLHSGLGVCAVGAFLAAAAGTELPAEVVLTVCLIIAVATASGVRRPGYLTFGTALVPVTIALLTLVPVGYTWRTPILMLAIHAAVRLSWYTTQVSALTRVELTVLGAEGRRFAVVNLVGQAVALVAGALTAVTEGTAGMGWTGVMGALALLVLALALRTGARSWPLTSTGTDALRHEDGSH